MAMKKIIITLLAVCIMGAAAPVVPVLAENNINVGITEGSKLQKAAKVSKKSTKEKKKNTKSRVKKLNQLGIPKSYRKYGKDLSLRELGNIIAVWIMDVWVSTGQLPSTITNDPPSWLMLNVNGSCLSGPCERWEEE